MKAQGVDISVWQDNNSTPQMFDPHKARSMGASFVGIKTSQADWADPDFTMNWANCRRVLYRLPYHFLVWDKPAKKQAETFWGLLEAKRNGEALQQLTAQLRETIEENTRVISIFLDRYGRDDRKAEKEARHE